VRDNGPTFSGRAGARQHSKYEDRDAGPVRCNGWLSRAISGRIALEFKHHLCREEASGPDPDKIFPAAAHAMHHAQQSNAVNET
jgi:hypothetical protein